MQLVNRERSTLTRVTSRRHRAVAPDIDRAELALLGRREHRIRVGNVAEIVS